MALTVVDSDVLIDALRGRREAADRIAFELRSGTLATTAISVFELLSGATRPADRELIQRLLQPMPILAADEESALRAAEVRRLLDAAGTPIGMADYLIAGICLSHSAVLLTRNRRHFERVPGLAAAFVPE